MSKKLNSKTTSSRKSTKAHAAVSAAAFEALEDRRMFSVVTVDGTNANDVISLVQGPTIVRVLVNGVGRAYIAARVDGLEINGFDGSDRVLAGPNFSKPIVFHGGNGNDSIIPGRGNDRFDGGAGADLMQASVGSDEFLGGPDTDTMDYSSATLALNVTLDDAANDGVAGGAEGDNIHSDVENVNGGFGNDSITGSAANNVLTGGGGTDTLRGMDGDDWLDGGIGGYLPANRNNGNDVLYGGNGSDTLHASDSGDNNLYGEAGNDNLYGYNGDDTLDGGSGRDNCYGGAGQDLIYGGGGNDFLDGQEGQDTVYGNYGPRARFLIDPIILNPIVLGDAAPEAAAPGAPIDSMITPLPIIDRDIIVNPLPPIDVLPIQPIDYVLPPREFTPVLPKPDLRLVDPILVDRIIVTLPETDDDIVHGGAGEDRVRGDGGNDQVFGDDGDDFCYGDAGNDVVHGGNGEDHVYGGAGDDDLVGDAGDDVLVSIGGGQNDENTGGDGLYSVGLEAEASELDHNDFWSALFEGAAGTHHRVGGFQQVTNGSATQTPSRELNGQNLIDPATKGGLGYQNFSDRPLFGHLGPHRDDIDQGALADCYFLAGLSAVAKTNATRIHESVVDLGDGTYAVQFMRSGNAEFFRVDGDLPAPNGGNPSYQNLGHDDALWAAVMEKAFCYRRSGAGTYASIEYGGADAFDVMGLSHSNVMAGNAIDTLRNIKAALDDHKAVIVGTKNSVPAGCPCVGNHMYSVHSVSLTTVNFLGLEIVTGGTIVVRNPWHVDGGGNNDGVNDGYVTLDASQFFSGFNWGRAAVA